jgi:hypothetical protein
MRNLRWIAGMLVGLMTVGLTGCGGGNVNASSPRGGSPMPYSSQDTPRQGMSTRNKMLLLAGAAAVYYMYQKHKNAPGEGPNGKYYRSKNGRVYYRDLKTGDFKWVDAPQQPIEVPAEEYSRYTGRSYDDHQGGVIRQAPPNW